MDYSVRFSENDCLLTNEQYPIKFGEIRIIQSFASKILTIIDYGVGNPENFTNSSVEELVEELGRKLSIDFTSPDNFSKINNLLEGGGCIIVTNYTSVVGIKIFGSSGTNEKCSIIIEDKTALFTELETMIDRMINSL